MSADRKPKKAAAKAPHRRPYRRYWVGALLVFCVILAVFAYVVIRPFWRLAGQFEDLTYRQPSRLYARSAVLQAGRAYPAEQLIQSLRNEGYREAPGSPGNNALPAGRYRKVFAKGGGKSIAALAVHLRSFLLPDGKHGGVVEVDYDGPQISGLRLDGQDVASVPLQPALIGTYFGSDLQERRPVTVDNVSEDLVEAVIAAEDDSFFEHSGVSYTGIARALWVDLRGGEIRQGGSTLTQQLVKNIYLSHERTLGRKGQELILALLLEARYSKRQILEAYLNEIYLGSSGGVSLMGMGAASRAFFGKDPGQIDLAEAATLAGMIRAPAVYSPLAHPDKAKERRDWVLGRIAKLGRVPKERIDQALAEPVSVAPEPVVRRRAPYFADAMAEEAQRRFGIEDLTSKGYILFSTLDLQSQKEAQEAVEWGLDRAQEGYQKGQEAKGPLQAALVSIAPSGPDTGGILAYVGGRDYDKSQFDRAGQAERQAGSAFKPIVYSAAFENHVASPSSFLEDSPLTVSLAANASWSPKNDDGSFHGWVSVRTALEKSYNPATARLALQVGMPKIVALAHKMGVAADMEAYPSVALGAVDLTPVELATVYATLAAGGVRPPVHGLAAILDRTGKVVPAAPLPKPERVISPQTAYMVTSLLQGVLVRGTARGAAAGIPGDVAGKTGTTNRQRDSWFGGFARERATVVWVGYDDNSSTRLSGARAALPIWVRFTAKVAPRNGYSVFEPPPGLTTAVIDPTTGLLATEFCPVVLTEVFREGEVPTQLCDRHQSWMQQEVAQTVTAGDDEDRGGQDDDVIRIGGRHRDERSVEEPAAKSHPFKSWLRRIFGGRGDRDRDDQARGREDRRGQDREDEDRKPPE
jgi:penicillin-binding protein 1B